MSAQRMTVSSLEYLCIYEVSKHFLLFKYELQCIPIHVKNHLLRIAGHRLKLLEDIALLKSLVHPNIEEITLANCSVSDEMLDVIPVCSKLKKIELGNTNESVTCEGLSRLLPKISNVQFLSAKDCNLFDDLLIDLMVQSCPKLSTLELMNCINITDDIMRTLGSLKLIGLNIAGTNISDAGMMNLLEGECAETLTELNVCRCPMTEKSVILAIDKCKKLSIFILKDTKLAGDFIGTSSLHLKQLAWTIL